MKQVNRFWLPDNENHLIPFLEDGPEFASGPTYQIHKFQACFPHIKNFRLALDIGGHCGLWSRPMAAVFAAVHAFEPVLAHRECFLRNMKWFEIQNAVLHDEALGDHDGVVRLHTGPSSSGDTYVKDDGEHSARMVTLDSFGLTNVDFIKLDCEGFEFFAIKGGEQTIRRDKPCVIVEQKPNKGKQFGLGDHDAVELLRSWGMKVIQVISGDFVMRWK